MYQLSKVINLDKTTYFPQQQSGIFFKAKEKSPQQQETERRYIKWRTALLSKKENEGKLVHSGFGDRGSFYLQMRQKFLQQRQQKTHKRSNSSMEKISNTNTHKREDSSGIDLRDSGGSQSSSSAPKDLKSSTGLNPTHHRRGSSISQIVSSIFSTPEKPTGQSQEKIRRSGSTLSFPRSGSTLFSLKKTHEEYAFTGMHHIFDHHKDAVSTIEFANEDRNLIAFASRDGYLTIATVFEGPPTILHHIKAHEGPVNDLSWMVTNDFLISVGNDAKCIVWNVKEGKVLREIQEKEKILSCLFHPVNNNIFFVNIYDDSSSQICNEIGEVKSINLSTGKEMKKIKVDCPVTTLCSDNEKTLFAGDHNGFVHTLLIPPTGEILKISSNKLVNRRINSIHFKTWLGKSSKSLLVNSATNTVQSFHLQPQANQSDQFVLEFKVPLSNEQDQIKSRFCPVTSHLEGFCIVSGGEDMTISIHDSTREPAKSRINQLQGHSGAVLDVCWNYDESLLASCDESGIVILWKR